MKGTKKHNRDPCMKDFIHGKLFFTIFTSLGKFVLECSHSVVSSFSLYGFSFCTINVLDPFLR